jgi:hypothetical protein
MAFGISPRARLVAGALSFSVLLACGGSAPPPAAAEANEPAAPPPVAPAPAAASEESPAAEAAEAAEPSEATDAPPPAPEEPTRQVRYIVNPEGMRVRVAGVELVPRAEVVEKGGTLSIKLRVEARSEDGKKHSLLAPAGKELALAGTLRRSDGSEEKFGDEREGERELVVDDGKDVVLTRTFPDKGAKPLKSGDQLELAVGLWGLGDDAASRRPVRGLCKVTLSYPRNKPKLKLTPPDGLSK